MSERVRPALSSAEIKLRALDALEVAFVTGDPADAAQHARSMLAGLDAVTLERIGGWLACLVVKSLLMRELGVDEVRRALDRWRVEAMEQLLAPADGSRP